MREVISKPNTSDIPNLTSFFNFVKNNIDPDFQNPCDTPIIKKMFKAKPLANWNILEKEIVSKVILRHANLSTTQRYLGKVSDTEAMRWIENLYA